MSIEKVRNYFQTLGIAERIMEFDVSSATVELAAQAVGVEGARIAKTLSFLLGDGCILIVAAGDAKIDNKKYKAKFGAKAKMLAHDDVPEYIGRRACASIWTNRCGGSRRCSPRAAAATAPSS